MNGGGCCSSARPVFIEQSDRKDIFSAGHRRVLPIVRFLNSARADAAGWTRPGAEPALQFDHVPRLALGLRNQAPVRHPRGNRIRSP